MKNLKKILCLLLAVLMAFSALSGCKKAEEPAKPDAPAAEDEAAAPTETTDLGDLKVAFVTDGSGTDGSWCQANFDAAQRVKKAMGFSDDNCVIMEQIDAYSPDAESVIEMLATNGTNLIICCSSGYTNAIAKVAARHPEVYFAQFEGGTAANVKAYSVRDYTGVFLCGYAMARMSEGNEMGFVGCQPQASVVRALNAFAIGAKYANPDATVKVLWANSWYDPAKEKEATNTFLNEGMNVVGFYGGTTAVAVATGEKEGCYTNGYNVDMHDASPKSVVTSFVWQWDPIFTELINMVAEDRWNNETIFSSIEDGACDVAPFNADIMPADVVADCNALREKMLAGEIEVFKAPVYDNKGNCVLKEGEEFSMEDYVNMLFLVDNVIGELPKS